MRRRRRRRRRKKTKKRRRGRKKSGPIEGRWDTGGCPISWGCPISGEAEGVGLPHKWGW